MDTVKFFRFEKIQELNNSDKSVKKEIKKYGIYLFPCNKCDGGIFALHIEKCLSPNCESINKFR